MPAERRRVLFLCTGNSCRSQMAEVWLRELAGDRLESLSAGSKPAGYVHPLAIRALEEAGLAPGELRSKSISEFVPPAGTPPQLVISVCDAAAQECPVFPGDVARLHWPFDDPAHAEGSEGEKMACFRRVRDEIRTAIEQGLADGTL
ncbi:MAG: arsenate reductase ArsC [Planctomycetaceae bacterium]|nr:arsenate reductase ArsC [Planctomycetaceae bacterium]